MRITGGFARGHKIKVPGVVLDLRPAQDVVRQAVFNWLASHFELENPQILDLFAGTGSFGLEALSRGARHCLFVDRSRKACQALQSTLKHSRFLGKAKVTCQDAFGFVSSQPRSSFDLIFLDPPYRLKMDPVFLEEVGHLLKDEGVLVYSHAKSAAWPPVVNNLAVVDKRTYGASAISFLTKKTKDDKMPPVTN